MTELNEGEKRLPNLNPPEFSKAVLGKEAEYGVLKQLEGTWVNYESPNMAKSSSKSTGLSVTGMPSPGTNSESMPGFFHFICGNYTEELKFKLVEGAVRNRGGTNEQFAGAVEYTQTIKDLEGQGIHEENGMYLWLDNMYVHPVTEESTKTDLMGLPKRPKKIGDRGELFLPQYTVARSGTIPHGSTMQLLGKDYTEVCDSPPPFPKGKATWDWAHLSIDKSMFVVLPGDMEIGDPDLDEGPPVWTSKTPTELTGFTYIQRIFTHELYPYSVRPDLLLRDAIEGQTIKKYTLIHMGTRFEAGPQGGVLNTPMVAKYCPATEVRYRMWLETVEEHGEEILQLQYEQIVFFEFSFFVDGSLTRWPHIQVNTLRKKK